VISPNNTASVVSSPVSSGDLISEHTPLPDITPDIIVLSVQDQPIINVNQEQTDLNNGSAPSVTLISMTQEQKIEKEQQQVKQAKQNLKRIMYTRGWLDKNLGSSKNRK
jgi:hypothetical protein